MCTTTTRTERIWVSPRTRQLVGRQQFALALEGRFTPCRDSPACTIVMRLQRELPEYCSRGHARYSHSWITATTQRLSGPTFSATIFRRLDESACNSKPKNLSQGKRNLFVSSAQRFGEPQPASREGRHSEVNCELAMHHWRDNQ